MNWFVSRIFAVYVPTESVREAKQSFRSYFHYDYNSKCQNSRNTINPPKINPQQLSNSQTSHPPLHKPLHRRFKLQKSYITSYLHQILLVELFKACAYIGRHFRSRRRSMDRFRRSLLLGFGRHGGNVGQSSWRS